MIVVVKEVGQPAARWSIDGRRKERDMDTLIGGYPSRCLMWKIGEQAVAAWCDDDGISKDLPINFARPTDGADIRGTVVVTSMVEEGRDWSGLSNAEADEVIEYLAAFGVER